MQLFDASGSPNTRKIRALANELDLKLDVVAVDMQKGDHKTAEYLARNPNGKVPVLVDGDFSLWESNAIMCYIAAKQGKSTLLPTTPRGRAEVDQWLFWQMAHLQPAIGKIMMERYYKARMNLGAPDEAMIEQGNAEVARFGGVLNDRLAKRDFITGALSVVDFSIAGTFAMREVAQIDLAALPHVQGWIKRMETRPSWVHAA